jgi:hypothetical protein
LEVLGFEVLGFEVMTMRASRSGRAICLGALTKPQRVGFRTPRGDALVLRLHANPSTLSGRSPRHST